MFRRALERGNLMIAETTAREIGRIDLVEALELTALIALKDPRRHARAASRWLGLYAEAGADVGTLTLAWGGLAALGGAQHREALELVRSLCR